MGRYNQAAPSLSTRSMPSQLITGGARDVPIFQDKNISLHVLQVGVLRVLHGREAGDAPERAVHVPAPRGHHDRRGAPALHARQGARSVNELIGRTGEGARERNHLACRYSDVENASGNGQQRGALSRPPSVGVTRRDGRTAVVGFSGTCRVVVMATT